ncbi:MAG TPA: NPCBM/NEW2 domain-containing protein [Phycisphaerae bacterium]|nr:NPCBM/NEW2 domain-containing protein [Phycisphaerae bacterium]
MRVERKIVGLGLVVAVCLAGMRVGVAASLDEIRGDALPKGGMWMETMKIGLIDQGYGQPRANQSVDRHPITLHGEVFKHGVGSHAPGEVRIRLDGAATRFVSAVGIDDETQGNGAAKVIVTVDGKQIAETGDLKGGGEPAVLDVDLTGAKEMVIEMVEVGSMDYAHVDFAGAMLVLAEGAAGKPQIVASPAEAPITLPRTDADGKVRINGARVIGSTPGRPFVFKVPVTGPGIEAITATGLPDGLQIDPHTGVISGTLRKPGVTVATVSAIQRRDGANFATDERLIIVGGERKLALTPPMGWNSWNCFAGEVSQDKVKAAADEFISTGLAAHGFTFVNIDDCWEGKRDATGMIQTNEKFPDMKGLGDYIHSLGLKFGIYSSPGPKTCAGFEASYQHEDQDARQWSNWGVDYVKYDLCSFLRMMKNPGDPDELKKVYGILRGSLDKAPRDIVYSLCEYGYGNVWEWGADAPVHGNLWRTTGDITDTWGSMAGIGFQQNGHEKYAGPGHWNDPDMLVVGRVGWGDPHPSRLTQNEQLTHISLWSILAAPLLIGCDLTQMDDFTKGVLMNDEVLAVNQDPLGKQGYRVDGGVANAPAQVWKREMWDGTIAVGLFNLSRNPQKVTATWSELQIAGPQPVRDLWQLKDLGDSNDAFSAEVPRHGCVLVKIGKPATEDVSVAKVVGLYQGK